MYIIPLIYFSFLLYYIIHKHGFDISASMVSLYILTSFFTILIYVFELKPYSDIKISFIPTFIYCSLTTLIIYPFYRFNSNKITHIVIPRNIKLFNAICYIGIAIFVIFIIYYFNHLHYVLTSGDLGELRKNIYSGNFDYLVANYSGIIKYLIVIVNILSSGTYILLLLFFYSLCFLNKSKLFNYSLFVGSLSPAVFGMLTVDRSKLFFWVLLFYLLYTLFRNFIGKKQKKVLFPIFALTIIIFVGYFLSVTISRFDNLDHGAEGGFITYAGQSFINFCNLWDNLNLKETNYNRIFPMFYKYILNDNTSASEWCDHVFSMTGINVNVFFSSIGHFLVDVGRLSVFIYALTFYIIASLLVTPIRKSGIVSFGKIIILFLLAIVPQIGIITYYYCSYERTFALFLFLFIANFFKFRKVI